VHDPGRLSRPQRIACTGASAAGGMCFDVKRFRPPASKRASLQP
jgi:hypothetical protein